MEPRRWSVGIALTAVVLAACGSNGSASNSAVAVACRNGSGVSAHATTASYVMQLDIGPTETMYTPEQVRDKHPTSGEVMLSGTMTDMSGGGMGGMAPGDSSNVRHLEVHICSRTGGKVVEGAQPRITVGDASTPSVSQDVPVAVMEGVSGDGDDYHYGNNVAMAPNRSLEVRVTLNGQAATFRVHTPNASPATTVAGAAPTMSRMAESTTIAAAGR